MKIFKQILAIAMISMMTVVFMPMVPGMNGVAEAAEGAEFYAVFNTATEGTEGQAGYKPANTLSFYYDANKATHTESTETVYDNLPTAATESEDWGYLSKATGVRTKIKNVVIDNSVKDYHGLVSTAYMFYGISNADSISGCEYLDVSNVTNMSSTFRSFASATENNPSKITVVPDVSKWNTENVTNMESMFHFYANYSNITVVPDVSKWNTKNVKNMKNMFRCFAQISTVVTAVPNVSDWDTGSVENMNGIFYNYALKSTVIKAVPDVSKWNTENVTDMNGIFNSYANTSTVITAVPDVSGWKTDNVTDMCGIFYGYARNSTSITVVPNVSGWNTKNVTNMSNAFIYYAAASKVITAVPNVSNWNTGNVQNMKSMFEGYAQSSENFTAVPDVSKWNTKNVTYTASMFREYAKASTSKLDPLDLSEWDISKIEDDTSGKTTKPAAEKMFYNYNAACSSGNPVVYAKDWSTTKSTGVTATDMFTGSKIKNADKVTSGNNQWSFANTSDTGCFTAKPVASITTQSGTTNYATVQAAVDAATKGDTVKLLSNVDLTATIDIAAGKEFTLDLNGKTLDGKNLTAPANEGDKASVIYVNSGATLTLDDSSTGDAGKITGGKGSRYVKDVTYTYGGGILNKGTLNIKRISITGNSATYGAGVYNTNFGNCTFNMYSGKISDNTATYKGGGVLNSGTMNMCGGEISGNDAGSIGGGVSNAGTMTVSGASKITGNTSGAAGSKITNNLNFERNKKLTIDTDGLATGAKIGVYTSKIGAFTTNGAETDKAYFTSDNQAYKVKYVPATTGETPVAAHLELANYDLGKIESDTTALILENDAMTPEQAIAIAKAQKPYTGLSKESSIVYKIATTSGTTQYAVIKASSTSDWQEFGVAMSLDSIKLNIGTKDYFVIGTVTNHTHSWTYTLSTSTKNNDTITAACGNDGCPATDTKLIITAADATYDESEHGAVLKKDSSTAATGFCGGALPTISYEKKNGSNWDTVTGTPKAAGEYRASISAGTDSGKKTASVEYKIAKGQSTATPPTATSGLVYSGQGQELVSGGNATHGTLNYALGENASSAPQSGWSTTVPKGSDAKKYYVWYKSVGDDNYKDSEPGCVEVSINKKEVTVSGITADNKTYDGATSATLKYDDISISGTVGQETITATASGTFASKDVGTGKTVNITDITLADKSGQQYLKNYTLKSSGNQSTATANITAKAVSVTAENKEMQLGDKLPTFTAKEEGLLGTDTVSYSFNTIDPKAQGVYSIVPTGDVEQGNYSVSYIQGELVVSKTDSIAKVDSKSVKQVLENYRSKQEYSAKQIGIEVRTDGEVPQADKDKITQVVGSAKKIIFTNTELYLTINDGEKFESKDIGDENDTLIAISYKFDFNKKTNIQVFRVHENAVEELKETPNTNGEYVTFDKNAGTITVYAKKYSSYAFVYDEVKGSNSSKSSGTSTGDNNNLVAYFILFDLMLAGIALVLFLRLRAKKK